MTVTKKPPGATKVMDLMTRNPIVVDPETTVEEVLAVMREAAIRHLPVVDDQGLLGVISERDLRFIHQLPGLSDKGDDDALVETLQAPVVAVMKSRFLVERDVTTVAPEVGIKRAIDLLVSTSVGALPVVDPDGTVVGMVSAVDIMRWVSDELIDPI